MPKMFKKLSEKLGAKFPATSRGYSIVKQVAGLDDTFSEFFELEASPVELQSLQQKGKKRRKRKGEKIQKFEKPKDVAHFSSKFGFLRMPEQKCGETRCEWKERRAVMLQRSF